MGFIGSTLRPQLDSKQPLNIVRHQPSRLFEGTLGRVEDVPRAVAGMRDAFEGPDSSPRSVQQRLRDLTLGGAVAVETLSVALESCLGAS